MSLFSPAVSKSRLAVLSSSLLIVATLAACNRVTAPAAPAQPEFNADISIDEMMEAIVMPTADALWKSTQVDLTAEGEKITAPTKEEEWLALRHQAVTLASVTNLLMIPSLKVNKDPASTKHGEGELSPAEITKLRDANLIAFAAHAQNLHNVAMKMIEAIDKRDVEAIGNVGGDLDAVCEACHTQFWYPNQAK